MHLPKIHLTPKQRRILLRVGVIIISALALTFFLEYRHNSNDIRGAVGFVRFETRVYLYTAFLMSLAIIFLSCFTRKPWTSVGILASLIAIITYIHIAKFTLRGSPLLPEDFLLADQTGTLTKFVDVGSIIRLLIAIGLIGVLTGILNRVTAKFLLPEKPSEAKVWWKKYHVATRILVAAVAVTGMILGTSFVRHHSGQKHENLAWLDTTFVAWNQTYNYQINGFLLGFLYNLDKFELKAPGGYSESAMSEIAAKYTEKAEAGNASRTSLADTDYNIVIVLNESFYDPAIIKEYYHHNDDVTPTLRQVIKKYPSGQMYSLDYGGGTATIEFEVFTGLSNYWANTVPYTDLLPKLKELEAVATFAKANGYATTAIHPFNGGIYKRDISLRKEGFDEFITEREMDYTEKEHIGEVSSDYINDRSSYLQVLKVLKESEQRQLVGLITMQNHSPYSPDPYGRLDFKIIGGLETDLERQMWVESYFQTLHSSDAYLGEFLEALDQSDEKTVVLFYGDHSGGVITAVAAHEDKEVRDLSRLTPYFIYANFDLGGAKKLPTETPNCLVNTMYNLLNVQKPALNYLLDEVCMQTPILDSMYLGEAGPFQSTEISEYELINYDVLGGEQYWYKFTGDSARD